jgi:hypothetical protein
MSRIYLDTLHAHKVVSAKTDMLCALCKKRQFCAKIIHFSRHFLCFFYIGHKLSVLRETLRAHIEYVPLHEKTF